MASTNDNDETVTIPRATWILTQREANINQRPIARHLLGAAKYLGIGALAHAWFLGTTIDPHSAWSWGYILAWPVPVLFWLVCLFLIVAFYAVILIVACATLWWCALAFMESREKRRRKYDPKRWMEPA